jgi:hypothetical protein
MLKLKFTALALMAAALTLLTGCNTQPAHPNQINAFDGTSYDTLTLAHAALGSLRTTVSTNYRQYVPAFNQAAASYSTAYDAYALFRTAPSNQAGAALALSNLTFSIVSLENAFQLDLHVPAKSTRAVRARAARMRAAAAPKITISDILTELEIAASIAATVPGAQPYSTLASVVIRTTQEAVSAVAAAEGQPIDMTNIQPIPSIQ